MFLRCCFRLTAQWPKVYERLASARSARAGAASSLSMTTPSVSLPALLDLPPQSARFPFTGFVSDAGAHRGTPHSRSLATNRHAGIGTNPVMQGLYSAFQLPPNPFTYKPKRLRGPKLVLYRGRGMLLFRFIVRMKIFQLVGVFTVATLMSTVFLSENATTGDMAAAAAVVVGCIVTSYCVWYYSGRYVGELSLVLPERKELCFSVLDFWGSRQDDIVPLEHVVAPFRNRSVAEVKAMVRPVLMPLRVKDQEYYISMAHGEVLEEQVLLKVLYGKFTEVQKPEAVQEQQQE